MCLYLDDVGTHEDIWKSVTAKKLKENLMIQNAQHMKTEVNQLLKSRTKVSP